MQKIWNYKSCDYEKALFLSERTGLSKYTCQLLINRGINTLEEINEFLKVVTKLELESWDKETSNKIGLFLKEKIINQELITVHGDYDVDGVTGAAVLSIFLKSKGANFNYYLPDRFGDGYGLSAKTIENLAKNGTKVIITADCGIANNKEIELANSLGIDVIVTDHHTLPEELPKAKYIFHPALSEDKNFHILSGVGTAFQLIYEIDEIIESKKIVKLEDYLDLVAIGTIADISPLKGINRNLVKYGLTKLRNTNKIGLLKLMEMAGVNKDNLNAQDVSFKIVPRLNATGRMNKALISLDLILAEKEEEAFEIAQRIEIINKERQVLCEKTYLEIEEMIKKEIDLEKEKAIFISGENFHHGVIGIICSKLLEKYNRPVFITAIEGETSRGSARSKNIHLVDCLKSCSNSLIKSGGHAGAAGWSLETNKISEFKNLVLEYAENNLNNSTLQPQITLEVEIPIDEINYQLFRELQELEPFGLDNPEPLIYAKNVRVNKNSQYVSKDGNHLFFESRGKNKKIKTAFWNKAELFPLEENIDLVYSINESKIELKNQLRLRAIEIKQDNKKETTSFNINKIKDELIELDFNIEEVKNISDNGYIYNFLGKNKINFLNLNKIEEFNYNNIEFIDLRDLELNKDNLLKILKEGNNIAFNIFTKKELDFEKELKKLLLEGEKKALILFELPEEKEHLNYIFNLLAPEKVYLFHNNKVSNKIDSIIIKSFINSLYLNSTSLKNFIFTCYQIEDFKTSYFKYITDILLEAGFLLKDNDKYFIRLEYKNIDINNLETYKKYLEFYEKENYFNDLLNKSMINKVKSLYYV
ncbi:MAG: single-stranded-DNA-specific exonuclease RecJ [Candidatus Sericytochromatia bacterium]